MRGLVEEGKLEPVVIGDSRPKVTAESLMHYLEQQKDLTVSILDFSDERAERGRRHSRQIVAVLPRP